MKLWDVVTLCVVLLNTINAANKDHFNKLGGAMDFIKATTDRLKPDKPSKLKRNQQNEAEDNSSSMKERRKVQQYCALAEIRLKVTDMGLGYKSEEQLVFRYCVGSCKSSLATHDQILKNLIRKGTLNKKDIRLPCCRATAYGDESFLGDDQSTYHILRNFSAKGCHCT